MHDTLDILAKAWRSQGRTVTEVDTGIGVEFDDGYDVWWILPGESLSSVEFKPDQSVDVEAIQAEFERLNERRGRAIHVLRHYLARRKIAVNRVANGQWRVKNSWGCEYELTVGQHLTGIVDHCDDTAQVLRELVKGTALRKAPSGRLVKRLLNTEGQPKNELEITDENEDETLISPPDNWSFVFRWMGFAENPADSSDFSSVKAIEESLRLKDDAGCALYRMAERLKNVSAAYDLAGYISIEFDDGEASMKIRRNSPELAKWIEESGANKAGDRLADEFERLNRGRKQIINAVKHVMREQGYLIDDEREVWAFGKTHREVMFDPGDVLTEAIKEKGVEYAVCQQLADHEQLVKSLIIQLDNSLDEKTVHIDKAQLPAKIPSQPYPLPELSELDINAIDNKCQKILDEYLKSKGSLSGYFNPLKYKQGVDVWCSADRWLEVAREQIELIDRYMKIESVAALLIAAEIGDKSDEKRLVKYLEGITNAEPHCDDELIDEDVFAIWRYRDHVPQAVERFFTADEYDEVPYEKPRARVGDPIAVRYIIKKMHDYERRVKEKDWESLTLLSPQTANWHLSEHQIEEYRVKALEWAGDSWDWLCAGSHEVLEAAASMNWPEVAERLESNPHVVKGLLEKPAEGIIFAEELFLAWSYLHPGDLLTRLLGLVLTTDIVARGLIKQWENVEPPVDTQQESLKVPALAKTWETKLNRSLAIAWTRCRNAMKYDL